jgi:RNA polymerase sigma factor (sigma-70 family)
MQAMDDMTLLREYAARHTEAAFAELVSRRVSFVYAGALRQVRDPHLAEEITQAVFIILAQKAGRISDKTILAGWLFKTTRFAAIAQMRELVKRQQRELEVQMQTELQSAAPDPLWEQMSPLLDEALASLGETDRQAVLLRFFENKSLAEVGSHLGTGEDTARKRVSRALEKLRRYFNTRGVSSTTAIIAGTISANSVQAAPVALAKSVTAVAIAKGAAASGSTLTLIKGALKIMAWTKAKMVIVVGVGMLIAAGTTTVVVKELTTPKVDDKWFEIGNLSKAPPNLLSIRPTKFSDQDFGGSVWAFPTRELGNHLLLKDLIAHAFGDSSVERNFSPVRMIFSEPWPEESFDYLSTVSVDAKQKFQAAIKKQLGFQARKEVREEDVLRLKLKTPDAPGLKATDGASPHVSFDPPTKLAIMSATNYPISVLVRLLESTFDVPVLDETGLKGNFDFALAFPLLSRQASLALKKSAQETVRTSLLNQLGLELVPSREPIEMLVVEKVK